MSYRILISAGDPSGDLLASCLLDALRSQCQALKIWAVGGPELKKRSDVFLENLTQHGLMGVFEPLRHLRRLWHLLERLRLVMTREKVDLVILVDFYGFNIRLAEAAKKQGIRVLYYVSPQVWASREGRVQKIKKFADRMLCLFPFEEDFYRARGMQAKFVGHPMAAILKPENKENSHPQKNDALRIGLMPGSRPGEIKRHWSVIRGVWKMLQRDFPHVEGVLYQRPDLEPALYPSPEKLAALGIRTEWGPAYESRKNLDLALTCSGMATLENMMMGIPQIVFYGVKPWWFFPLAMSLVRTPHVAMPNILAKKRLIPEITWGMSAWGNVRAIRGLAGEAVRLLREPSRLQELRQENLRLAGSLGIEGKNPSVLAAEEILKFMKEGHAPSWPVNGR